MCRFIQPKQWGPHNVQHNGFLNSSSGTIRCDRKSLAIRFRELGVSPNFLYFSKRPAASFEIFIFIIIQCFNQYSIYSNRWFCFDPDELYSYDLYFKLLIITKYLTAYIQHCKWFLLAYTFFLISISIYLSVIA